MRPLFFSFVFLLFSVHLHAQQFHFAYLQTDDKQPFYVRVNDKTYSSSSAGYLVIPKLVAGQYNLVVGFPKNQWPMQNLSIEIKDKDLGYLLKNFGEKGWGLFNIQTMDVAYASNQAPPKAKTEQNSGGGFSDILADVVNTPSIKDKPKTEPAKPVPVSEPAKEAAIVETVAPQKETVSAAKEGNENDGKESTVVPSEPKTAITITLQQGANEVRKISTVSDDNAMVMFYVVNNGESVDTVSVILPPQPKLVEAAKVDVTENSPEQSEGEAVNVPQENKKADELAAKPANTSSVKGEPKFIDIELPNPNNSIENSETKNTDPVLNKEKAAVKPGNKPLVMINSDCKRLADNDDFLKTRKKMAAESNPDDMISAARKQFRQKCYSTEQVKNLAVLFLSDEGKYRLFDAAYPFIHDTQYFPDLESELQDDYYKTRFRAMIKK